MNGGESQRGRRVGVSITALCAALAAALGAVLALSLSAGVPTARAALPCGILSTCPTTTTTTTAPPVTTTTQTTPSTTTTTGTGTGTGTPTPTPKVEAGHSYDGRAGNFGYADTITVAKNGKSFKWFVGFEKGSCSDGGLYGGNDFDLTAATVNAAGTATQNVSFPPGKASWYTKAGKKVIGAEQFTAHFSFHGKTVTGTLSDTFTSSKLTCHSGTFDFSADLDGTTGAPVRTRSLASGTYATSGMSLKVYAPWRAVTQLKVRVAVSCPKVKTDHPTLTLDNFNISPEGEESTFGADIGGSSKLPKGITARQSIDVSGTLSSSFSGSRQNYSATVSVSGEVDYYTSSGAQIPYSCTVSGSYTAPGPKNLSAVTAN